MVQGQMRRGKCREEESREEGRRAADQAGNPDYWAGLRPWWSEQVPYRDRGLVAPQRGHGAGRAGPRGRRGGAGERGRGARGRHGAGAEAQRPAADAVQEGAGAGGQRALGEPPPCPGQLRPHAAQQVQRAAGMAGAGARRGAGRGAAVTWLFLVARGGFFVVVVLALVLFLLLLVKPLLGSGLRAHVCSRCRH